MQLLINGQDRNFEDLPPEAHVSDIIAALGLKSDRVAIEHNGSIVPRDAWSTAAVREADKFEIVHFVGGGAV